MFKVSLFSNKKALERFALFQLAVIMITILCSYKIAYAYTHIIEQNLILNILFGVIGFVVVAVIHEFIHNLLFRGFSKGNNPIHRFHFGIISTHMPNVYFKKWQYAIIMLTPLVVITTVLSILFLFFSYSSLIFIGSFHIGYCLLDLYFVMGVLNNKVKYIEDTEEGLIYYTESPLQEVQSETK